MKPRKMDSRSVLYLVSAVILLAGLAGSVLIYRAAVADSNGDTDYQVIGGFVYPGGGLNSKRYIHDLQLYGGQAAVLSDEFTRWFLGLWQGTSLAYTVAFIAAFISFVIFVIANNIQTAGTSAADDGDSAG